MYPNGSERRWNRRWLEGGTDAPRSNHGGHDIASRWASDACERVSSHPSILSAAKMINTFLVRQLVLRATETYDIHSRFSFFPESNSNITGWQSSGTEQC